MYVKSGRGIERSMMSAAAREGYGPTQVVREKNPATRPLEARGDRMAQRAALGRPGGTRKVKR